MTSVYEWYSFPHVVDVVCPTCRGMAQFEFAEVVKINLRKDIQYFIDSEVFEYQQFTNSNGQKWHAAIWIKGIGVQNIDSIPDLPDGYSPSDWHHSRYLRSLGSWGCGSIFCGKCKNFSRHMLEWPRDAFWKVDFKNGQLWSFSRQSTVDILGFIESKHRIEKDFKWGYMLRHIPKIFLLEKSRDVLSRRIRKLLGISPAK